MEKITRRSMLKTIPACGLAGIVPATAAALPRSDVGTLYAAFCVVRDEVNAVGRTVTVENEELTMAPIWDRYYAARKAVFDATPVTASDVAMQFLVDCSDGDNQFSNEFLDNMRALLSA